MLWGGVAFVKGLVLDEARCHQCIQGRHDELLLNVIVLTLQF